MSWSEWCARGRQLGSIKEKRDARLIMGRLKALPSRLAAPAPKLRAGPKVAEGFYSSPQWRALVADLKRLRGPWCQDCGAGGRLYGDHIVERKDGGSDLDPMNVRLRCARCHGIKTAAERARRASGPIR